MILLNTNLHHHIFQYQILWALSFFPQLTHSLTFLAMTSIIFFQDFQQLSEPNREAYSWNNPCLIF